MTTLLVLTAGQTDVQLVVDGVRREFHKDRCGELHDELAQRGFAIVDAPAKKEKTPLDKLPEGEVSICTPKLDAVLKFFQEDAPSQPDVALIFDTRRTTRSDPRLAGAVLERRLKDRGLQDVRRHAFLTGTDWLEDADHPQDAVVRRQVVHCMAQAIAATFVEVKPDKVVVATTGGIPPANAVVEELVRLHAVGRAQVQALEVPDRALIKRDDVAIPEGFHPAAGIKARWQALSLTEGGHLLGAWGAVSHLENEPGQEWTKVIGWLRCFASSLPMPCDCNISVLKHPRMAVRAGLRVELALRARDIPRAVHGTVAFFEAALWDHLAPYIEARVKDSKRRGVYRLLEPPPSELCSASDGVNAFKRARAPSGQSGDWYYVEDSDKASRKLSDIYLKKPKLTALCDAVTSIRELRNDVAHNEPTQELMNDARERMLQASLWSAQGAFLSQPLIQDVLRELGEQQPERLCVDLIAEVRTRLLRL